jgi:dTDP-4-amino-4,6-dideoxygalactose transaminase
LKHLDAANARRREHATEYGDLLADCQEIVLPVELNHNHHVYHIFAVRVPDRDRVLQALSELGIACGIHYPVPLHLQEAYRFLGHARGAFPVAERCADKFLSLPMYPELAAVQVREVAAALKQTIRVAREVEYAHAD